MSGLRLRAISFLLAVLAAATACGGGGDAGPTKGEWIAQADTICAALAEELRTIPEPQTPEEAGESGRQVVEITSRRLTELRGLEPPPSDATTIDELLDAFEEVLALSDDLTEAIVGEDDAIVAELLPQLEARSREAERLAEAYGLGVCGQVEE